MCHTTKETTQERTKAGKMAKSHILQLLLLPTCLTLRCYSGLDSNYEVIQPPPRIIDSVPRSWSAGLSARELLAFASRLTLCPPHGPTKPCQTQASIPIRANTLAREAYIPAKAAREPNTQDREFSTRVWTGNSTLITLCPAELGRE